jgi:hypothetical protein
VDFLEVGAFFALDTPVANFTLMLEDLEGALYIKQE